MTLLLTVTVAVLRCPHRARARADPGKPDAAGRVVTLGYLWLFRGTPVLFQIIFIYNVLPSFGIRLSAFVCAVLALSLNEGAYMAEILRSGLQAVKKGQRTAGLALGMTSSQMMRHVVIPQAARIVLPPIGNQMIGMLKLSALVSVIAVEELLLVANQTASADFRYFEALTAAGIYYLAMTTAFMAAADPDRDARSIPRSASGSARVSVTRTDARDSANARGPIGTRTMRSCSIFSRSSVSTRVSASLQVLKNCSITVDRKGDRRRDRPVGLRQVDAAALPQPAGAGRQRRHLLRGRERDARAHDRRICCVRQIGMVFQNFELFSHLSAAENIMLAPVKILGISRADAHDIAVELSAEGPNSGKGGCLSRRIIRRPAAARRDCARARHEAEADALR